MGIEYARRTDDPTISVVIPSVPANDHDAVLEGLEEQTLKEPYEVLVINDASLDRSEARNEGLSAAGADIVALTDDDTRPPKDWLANIYCEFREDPKLVCLEGPVYGGSRNVRPRHYVGCNLAVQRNTALSVGGFRSTFSEWREDVEFGWRMEVEADGECRFSEDIRMCHSTVPRTRFKPELERRLRREYPRRYEEVINASLSRRIYRRGRALGVTQPLQRIRNRIWRLLFGGVCRDCEKT